nr:MAG TPA: hypothetical protein [Caudoviricetes sp.]
MKGKIGQPILDMVRPRCRFKWKLQLEVFHLNRLII